MRLTLQISFSTRRFGYGGLFSCFTVDSLCDSRVLFSSIHVRNYTTCDLFKEFHSLRKGSFFRYQFSIVVNLTNSQKLVSREPPLFHDWTSWGVPTSIPLISLFSTIPALIKWTLAHLSTLLTVAHTSSERVELSQSCHIHTFTGKLFHWCASFDKPQQLLSHAAPEHTLCG